ncbi:hypothetical protein ACFOGJ_19395 [Marinibaculum pumilum]|uniref:DUF4239 domain-containing protein n=1 Tax=Marinibaculum pumilum TaxID=1766165 RepID=A0ABV7L428_9PROT
MAEVSTSAGRQPAHLDWPAIIAGAVIATAVSFVLHTFGAALGLSVVSPFGSDGIGGTGLLIGMALWVLWVTVSSFMLGAYVTGRLRRRAYDATEHESDLRDGAHGLTVWALGVILGAFVLASGVDSASRTGAAAVSGVAEGAGTTVQAATRAIDEPGFQLALSRLLRPVQGGNGDAEQRRALQDEFGLMLEGTAGPAGTGQDAAAVGISDSDRAYMANVLQQELGLSEEQARARVSDLAESWSQLQARAEEAARTARTATVLGAFVLAAALLIAGAAAWVAAGIGGRHRDEQTVFRFIARRF